MGFLLFIIFIAYVYSTNKRITNLEQENAKLRDS